MLTVSNLDYIQAHSIKRTLGTFQDAFQVDVSNDLTVCSMCIEAEIKLSPFDT